MSDTYEVLTILQVAGKEPQVLRRNYLEVEYETDDRDSFVYTRTRKIKVPMNREHKRTIFESFSETSKTESHQRT